MKKNVISVRMSTYCLKLQSGEMGPSIFLTTSNTQSNKLYLLIQLSLHTPKNIKIKTKVRSQQIQCKGYIHIELF